MSKKGKWLSAPTVSGIYWAYREKKKNDQAPSLCRVNMLDSTRWRVTFLSGVESYTFTDGNGWQWMQQEAPTPPKTAKRKAGA